ncbi:hypothetical protein [Gordonia sp. (in: high G+C Gram-positive bacteria)]|uniref:hypothetical protein n=1 Tax=Gordonia sp. (in: high G+C Gram-positive bacteria) TaxID=84139 RepID=UPI0039E2B33E
MSTMKTASILVAMSAASAATFGVMSPAAAVTENHTIGHLCSAWGGDCGPADTFTVSASTIRMIVTNRGCSEISGVMFVDGRPSPHFTISEGQSSPVFKLSVPAASHKVGVVASARVGSCPATVSKRVKGDLNVQTDLDALMAS